MGNDVDVEVATLKANLQSMEKDLDRMSVRIDKQEQTTKMAVWAVIGSVIAAVMRLVMTGPQ